MGMHKIEFSITGNVPNNVAAKELTDQCVIFLGVMGYKIGKLDIQMTDEVVHGTMEVGNRLKYLMDRFKWAHFATEGIDIILQGEPS